MEKFEKEFCHIDEKLRNQYKNILFKTYRNYQYGYYNTFDEFFQEISEI